MIISSFVERCRKSKSYPHASAICANVSVLGMLPLLIVVLINVYAFPIDTESVAFGIPPLEMMVRSAFLTSIAHLRSHNNSTSTEVKYNHRHHLLTKRKMLHNAIQRDIPTAAI